MTVDKQALLDAVNDLIADDAPRAKLEALDVVYEVSRRHPVKLTGDMAVLNPLLTLRREDELGWENVKTMIDAFRAKAGKPPCWPAPKPERFIDRKNEYQRAFMLRKRERMLRASEIENLQREPHERLIGNARLDFERRVAAHWAELRDAALEKARLANGGKLSRDEAADIRDAFWGRVDAELDAKEEAVRRELLKPKHMRHKI